MHGGTLNEGALTVPDLTTREPGVDDATYIDH